MKAFQLDNGMWFWKKYDKDGSTKETSLVLEGIKIVGGTFKSEKEAEEAAGSSKKKAVKEEKVEETEEVEEEAPKKRGRKKKSE